MKGGNGSIKNEKELKQSWENTKVQSWVVNDGVGTMMNIFREDAATNKIMSYEKFKEKINYYLEQVVNGQKEAYIKEIY
jgi:tRNA-dihydrouridine synthase